MGQVRKLLIIIASAAATVSCATTRTGSLPWDWPWALATEVFENESIVSNIEATYETYEEGYSATVGLLPEVVEVNGQQSHVQGIAWDAATGRMYMSFTTRFVVAEADGTVVGSIDRINGHLGAMTFDPKSRRVYASLECKDDAIGQGVAQSLGTETFKESTFYIAEIDVDAITGMGIPEAAVLRRILVTPACEDYADSVQLGGRTLPHRYACSGIDGITIGPRFGKNSQRSRNKFLYVAYGIYGDNSRADNDHQVILQYPLKRLQRRCPKPRKIFIHTGNTNWGVQNLAYDRATDQMFLAVYKGSKSDFPNYDLFAVPMSQHLRRSHLNGAPYERRKVLHATVGDAWHYPLGSCGLCPIGNGQWYIADPGRDDDGAHNCRAVLKKFTGEPF